MNITNKYKLIYAAIGLAVVISVFFIFDEIDDNGDKKTEYLKSTHGESFTFFDLGADTELSDESAERLSGELGSYAVEKMTTLDLIIRDKIFFNKNFPKLFDLNYKLNDETGERIEHNITNLVFRYPPKEKTPFDNVKLVFSNYSMKPLLFIVSSRKKEADIADVLKSKYGEPVSINWDDGKSLSFLWEKKGDYLVFSRIWERGGFKYSIMIYFVNNMENLLIKEQDEIKKREEDRKKAGKTAF
jgi:hypothetical protein